MEANKKANRFEVGILGGGQLARMMALKAHELGIHLAVFSESPTDPAAQVTQNWFSGSLKSPKNVSKFLKK